MVTKERLLHIRFNIVIIRRPIYTLAIARKTSVPLLHATFRVLHMRSAPEAVQGVAETRRESTASVKGGKSRILLHVRNICRKSSAESRKGSSAAAPRAKRALNCPKERRTLKYGMSTERAEFAGRAANIRHASIFFSSFLPRRFVRPFYAMWKSRTPD